MRHTDCCHRGEGYGRRLQKWKRSFRLYFELFKEIDCLLLVTYAIITKSTAEQGESYGE